MYNIYYSTVHFNFNTNIPDCCDATVCPRRSLRLFSVRESGVVEVVEHERLRDQAALVVVVSAAVVQPGRGTEI